MKTICVNHEGPMCSALERGPSLVPPSAMRIIFLPVLAAALWACGHRALNNDRKAAIDANAAIDSPPLANDTPPMSDIPSIAIEAGGEVSSPECVGREECTCVATSGCAAIAESCWCPSPKCEASANCVCGGGRFISCAPANWSTCATAKARIGALCPSINSETFKSLCDSPMVPCTTKCLAEVKSCIEVSCSFCDACDCAGDAYGACYQQCVARFGR